MPEVYSLCKGPKEAFEGFVDKGSELCRKPLAKVFHQAFYAGCYIGFGGMVSVVVAGGLKEVSELNPGVQSFVFAALFPVSLLLILLTGGVLFTTVTALVPAAVYEDRAQWSDVPRLLAVSWVANFCGSVLFALLVTYAGMNTGPTAELASEIAVRKCSADFLQTFVKGISSNFLLCMAVFLVGQAQDMSGKMVGIWFPVSCFVAIGFEDVPANMFILPLGLLAGADVTVGEVIVKNLIPATLGDAFGGAIVMAMAYAYAFGRFGSNVPSRHPVERCSNEQFEEGAEAPEEEEEVGDLEDAVGDLKDVEQQQACTQSTMPDSWSAEMPLEKHLANETPRTVVPMHMPTVGKIGQRQKQGAAKGGGWFGGRRLERPTIANPKNPNKLACCLFWTSPERLW